MLLTTNYAFLQNLDRHVHLHVIPRYAAPREFEGERFEDRAWPDHYPVPGKPMPERWLPTSASEALVAKLS